MDPITIIVMALALGAAARNTATGEQAVKDAYVSLKALIQDKYQSVNLSLLESDPAAGDLQKAIRQELEETDADQDKELLRSALSLLRSFNQYASESTVNIPLEDVKAAASLTMRELEPIDYNDVEILNDGVRDIRSLLQEINLPLVPNMVENRLETFIADRLLGRMPDSDFAITPAQIQAIQEKVSDNIQDQISANTFDPDVVVETIAQQIEEFSTLRLEAALPEKVTARQSFELAVAIRRQSSPPLSEVGLDRTEAIDVHVSWAEDMPFVQLRAKISAPECDIHGENPQHFRLYRWQDSPVIYFHLTPRQPGEVGIIVTVYQEVDWLGGARLHTVAIADKVAGHMQIQVTSHTFSPTTKTLTRFREALLKHFNKSELKTLCADLGVDYDDLSGDNRIGKARELLAFLARHDRFLDLVGYCQQTRPRTNWEALAGIVPTSSI